MVLHFLVVCSKPSSNSLEFHCGSCDSKLHRLGWLQFKELAYMPYFFLVVINNNPLRAKQDSAASLKVGKNVVGTVFEENTMSSKTLMKSDTKTLTRWLIGGSTIRLTVVRCVVCPSRWLY